MRAPRRHHRRGSTSCRSASTPRRRRRCAPSRLARRRQLRAARLPRLIPAGEPARATNCTHRPRLRSGPAGDGDEGQSRSSPALPPQLRAQAICPHLLTVTKSNSRSTVHRPAISTSSASRPSGRRPGEWRASRDRPARLHRLRRQPADDPAAAAQGGGRVRACRFAARRPRRQGVQTLLERTRATSCCQIEPDESTPSPWASCASASASAIMPVRPRRSLLPLRVVLIYVPRSNLQHRPARRRMQAVLIDAFKRAPPGSVRPVFGSALAHPVHGPHAPGRIPTPSTCARSSSA